MRNYITISISAIALLLVGSIVSANSGDPAGLTQYGYPHVVGTITLKAGQSGTLKVPDQYSGSKDAMGTATVKIPSGAFSVPVKFQVLASRNSAWDNQVKTSQKVVANFAYRVIDTNNGKLVKQFQKPVTYTVKDPMITSDSIYWATTAKSSPKIINANTATRISNHTLMHPQPVATVGWIITTPKSDLSGSSNSTMSGSGY